MNNLPLLSADLINLLDKQFPELAPDPSDSEREIWMKAGERRVTRMLVAQLKNMEDNNSLFTDK